MPRLRAGRWRIFYTCGCRDSIIGILPWRLSRLRTSTAQEAILDPSRATESSDWAFDTAFDTTETDTPLALSIYSSSGLRTQGLHIPFLAIIIISLLILSQIAGLLALAVYTSMQPTWTVSLDGFTLLRMGKAMSENAMPLISAADAREALAPATPSNHGSHTRNITYVCQPIPHSSSRSKITLPKSRTVILAVFTSECCRNIPSDFPS